MKEDKKKIFLRTYGCQMNEYDSELIRTILTENNYTFTENEESADIILLNTCSVRDSAVRRIYGKVHAIKFDRKDSPPIIGILGCIPTNIREDLINDKGLDIDFMAGPDSYKKLPELIQNAQTAKDKPYDIALSSLVTYDDVYPIRESGTNAWIAIMRGCNNFCSFCVVPYTRGRERSRSVPSVVEEVTRLSDEGFKQVTLLGQNVNSYISKGADFSDLLNTISKIDNIQRIRFMSPHPKDFPDKLIETIANNPKVCTHIHLPLQSGSSRILELMNRRYTKEQFLKLVQKIKNAIPTITLTTDIIAGFPTETDEDFKDTLDVMETVEFDAAFIFKYSPRKGTAAEKNFQDDVDDRIKSKRTIKLNKIQQEFSLKKNQALIGQIMEVLIEKRPPTDPSQEYQGRTDGNKPVRLPKGNYQQGEFLNVKITDATPHVLNGARDQT